MNRPRATGENYVQYLLASPKIYSATEAGRVQPDRPDAPSHDAFTRLLNRLEPEPEALWQDVRPHVKPDSGILVLDDSTLDKPFAKHMGLVGRHWSGRHKRVVWGINLLTLLWTDGRAMWPCDYRVGDPVLTTTKNENFRAMLDTAKARGFAPGCVAFDSWYSGLDNLKAVRAHGWTFLTQLKCNRLVDLERAGYKAVSEQPIGSAGTLVHLKGFGTILVFRVVATDGHTEHWATNDLEMTEAKRSSVAGLAWRVEEFHRGLKQHTGVDRCQHRLRKAQRNHIGFAIRAFVRLEYQRVAKGVSWFESKCRVCRNAVRSYLAQPLYRMPAEAIP